MFELNFWHSRKLWEHREWEHLTVGNKVGVLFPPSSFLEATLWFILLTSSMSWVVSRFFHSVALPLFNMFT